MPRILIATTVPQTLRAFLLPLASHLRQQGWRVDAASSPRLEDARDIFDTTFDVPWARSPMSFRNFTSAPRTFRTIVARGGYDIVHVHTPVAAFVARAALGLAWKLRRPKVIYTAHGFHFHSGGMRLKNAAFRAAERCAGLATDYLVTINAEDAEQAKRFSIVPSSRIWQMPGIGIDLSVYARDRYGNAEEAQLRAELGIGEAQYWLMVAEFSKGKRHADLLKAFAAARAKCGDTFLILAGDGPRLAASVRLAKELGVSEFVRFVGHRRDVPLLLRGARLLVLPSEREGLPRCILEALAMEVPVVATDVRGCRDLLTGGVGVLCRVGDKSALTDALVRAATEASVRSEMARRGRERVQAYALETVLRLHDELYATAIGNVAGPESRG